MDISRPQIGQFRPSMEDAVNGEGSIVSAFLAQTALVASSIKHKVEAVAHRLNIRCGSRVEAVANLLELVWQYRLRNGDGFRFEALAHDLAAHLDSDIISPAGFV